MFDIGFDKIVLLAVIIGVLVGPKRLPTLAATLGRYVRSLRRFIEEKKSEVESELGADLGDIEWRKLDPRQYDPRRIVRDALFDGETDAERVVLNPSSTTAAGSGEATPPVSIVKQTSNDNRSDHPASA